MSALPVTYTLSTLVHEKSPAPRRKKTPLLRTARDPNLSAGLRGSIRGGEGLGADFAKLYHAYRRRIYSQCFCMLHNYDDAEDAAQEVFLQLFRKVHTFRGESSFSTWLYRLTTNCVLMEVRRKRHRFHGSTPPAPGAGDNTRQEDLDRPLDSYQARPDPIFERASISAAMTRLPSGYRKILQLHDVEGYTHQEIAELLGIRAGTSKSQLHKARHQMRRFLFRGQRMT